MIEKVFSTDRGEIHYFISEALRKEEPALVFLPGLTADHRLLEKQIKPGTGIRESRFTGSKGPDITPIRMRRRKSTD